MKSLLAILALAFSLSAGAQEAGYTLGEQPKGIWTTGQLITSDNPILVIGGMAAAPSLFSISRATNADTVILLAQSPEEFVKYQAAGSLTATIGTKPSADGKTQVPDPDKIVVCVRKFDSFAGTKGGPQCRDFSKAGIIADRTAMIARHDAELAAMDAAIAAIKAAQ